MKTAFWKADWFLGLVIAIVLFGFARMSGFIPGLERWAYDLGVKMTSKPPSEKPMQRIRLRFIASIANAPPRALAPMFFPL